MSGAAAGGPGTEPAACWSPWPCSTCVPFPPAFLIISVPVPPMSLPHPYPCTTHGLLHVNCLQLPQPSCVPPGRDRGRNSKSSTAHLPGHGPLSSRSPMPWPCGPAEKGRVVCKASLQHHLPREQPGWWGSQSCHCFLGLSRDHVLISPTRPNRADVQGGCGHSAGKRTLSPQCHPGHLDSISPNHFLGGVSEHSHLGRALGPPWWHRSPVTHPRATGWTKGFIEKSKTHKVVIITQ